MKLTLSAFRIWLLGASTIKFCSCFQSFTPFQPRTSLILFENHNKEQNDGHDKNNDKVASSDKNSSRTAELVVEDDSIPISLSDILPAVDMSPRLTGLDKPTVWHEFSPLAAEYDSVNLGQGFPDWNPPEFVIEAMIQATTKRNANQYARSAAHLPLATVLAQEYSEKFDRKIDPISQVATAVGCTNALYCALQGLLAPGDEVLLMEPAFDLYIAQTKLAGGVPKYVPLRTREDFHNNVVFSKAGIKQHVSANDVFYIDFEELEAAITPKTKVLILNTPHNPTGKMFSRRELESIRQIVIRHPQITVITDEVYEHIVFEPIKSPHISFASLPDMFERTLTLSSAGKTFSATGWKVGWAVGPPHLVRAVTSVQQWVNFSVATPNQDAIAICLENAKNHYKGFDSYYGWLANEYRRKRDLLVGVLETSGMTPYVPDGGFFIMADTSQIKFPYNKNEITDAMPTYPMPRDWSMSRWLTKVVGVTAIPPSAFYEVEKVHLAKNMLRFAFCKDDGTLMEAHNRFDKYFSYL